VRLSRYLQTLPLILYLIKGALNFVLFPSYFTSIVDGLCMTDEVLLDKHLVESEVRRFRVEVDVVTKFAPVARTDEGFAEEVDERQDVFEVVDGLFDRDGYAPAPDTALLAEGIQLVDILVRIFFEFLAVDVMELDVFYLRPVVLVPVLLEVPHILQVLYFLVHVVQVSRRGIADLEHFEAEDHIVPSIPQALHDIVVFIEITECVLVGVGRLEGSILFKVGLQVEGFLQEVVLVLLCLIIEDSPYSFVPFFNFQQHFVVVKPRVHEGGPESILLISELNGVHVEFSELVLERFQLLLELFTVVHEFLPEILVLFELLQILGFRGEVGFGCFEEFV
jgi:hypothetical protein